MIEFFCLILQSKDLETLQFEETKLNGLLIKKSISQSLTLK